MKVSLKTIVLLLAFSAASLSAYARMTDEQVIQYVKEAHAQGKSKEEIGQELLAKGVTNAQINRLKSKFAGAAANQSADVNVMDDALEGERVVRSNTTAYESKTSDGQMVEGTEVRGAGTAPIFGKNVFREGALTFEPNENLATPKNYQLGPGDEVIIDIWGTNEDHIRQTISPEGTIMISQVGPISLSGLTINEANRHIKNVLASKYAGISGEEPDSEVNVNLGQVRTIQVNIMGEAAVPGTYRLSPFSSVFHALYKAGGVTGIGSIRNIEVVRNGKKISSVDVYDYLFKGKQSDNITLREGDVIIVPPYEEVVNIGGYVKRPMRYEMKPNETLADLLNYAGGFTGDAYTDQITLARQTGKENELFNVDRGSFAVYNLKDGDAIIVGNTLDRFSNRVQVKGAVFRPGQYAINDELKTIRDLISIADGLTEDAFTSRAIIYRENPDLTMSIIPVDLDAILLGTAQDITLNKNDVLEIKTIAEVYERGTISIYGRVAFPGTFPYADNTTIEDLILMAGGLLQGASTARIDVSRRVIDPTSQKPTNEIAELFTLSFKDGYIVDGKEGFILKPYDIVEIRRSPGYEEQKRIQVRGEVAFPGGYTLETRDEKLSTIIRRSGGVNEAAFIKGAHIMRQMTEEEIAVRNQTLRMALQMENSGDSIEIAKLQLPTTYNVAIDLQQAMANPGGEYDVSMKDGDILIVPEITNTVKISGNVMFPNTVTYVPGEKLKYYIDNAGGYGENAKKNKAFIVYLNGTVARAKKNSLIEPGCQIIVPTKIKGEGVNWTAVLAVTSALGSTATMAAALANLFK